MSKPIIDTHIHFDLYEEDERKLIINEMDHYDIEMLITVSRHLDSARLNLGLAQESRHIKACFGFHPEQQIPSDQDLQALHDFLDENENEMVAVGEVGLPYYLRKENKEIPLEPYVEILESFIRKSQRLNKPIVLHAIYRDAPVVCSLLEKYSILKAHFHWFKGDVKTVERMIENGYFISVTPDVLYEEEIQHLVRSYPLSQMMVETDGPWGFEGPFQNRMTHPKMIHQTIRKISELKKADIEEVYKLLYLNTNDFYNLS